MRQTLFFIPDQLAGFPLFGFGWLLCLWVFGCGISLAWLAHRGKIDDAKSFLPFALLVAAALAFILPLVQVDIPAQQRYLLLWQSQPAEDAETVLRGLPIRGYGVFLLIATVSGVALATHRARQVGLSADAIFSLAFHMFVGGIVGARAFWIIQYWDQIYDPNSFQATLANMVNFVEGGLVVYGSLIGALVAACLFFRKHQLPALAMGDLIAPSLALGLAIGRIGCLMNGCCYGGLCQQPWAITFPQQSPPYFDQHRHGLFFGFRIQADSMGRAEIAWVDPEGPAATAGLSEATVIEAVNLVPTPDFFSVQAALQTVSNSLRITADGKTFEYPLGQLPPRTRPIHPTQLYSSVNAVLLCWLTLAYFPYRRRDGEVFALLIAVYAVTRFMLEVIRTDEGAMWGTGLTISQNVSLVMLVGVAVFMAYLWKQPQGSAWPQPDTP